jgi:hypothetical protein
MRSVVLISVVPAVGGRVYVPIAFNMAPVSLHGNVKCVWGGHAAIAEGMALPRKLEWEAWEEWEGWE